MATIVHQLPTEAQGLFKHSLILITPFVEGKLQDLLKVTQKAVVQTEKRTDCLTHSSVC